MAKKKIMFILRGLPGSGKSAFGYKLFQTFEELVIVCSADDFFYKSVSDVEQYHVNERAKMGIQPQYTTRSGSIWHRYEFNPALLPQAHNKCFCDAFSACSLGQSIVVIDNTNSQHWEYRNYEMLAKQFGYDVGIYETGIASTNYTGQNNVYSVIGKKHLEDWFNRQQHDVPLDIFLRMWWRWEIDQRAHVLTEQDVNPKCGLGSGLKREDFE